MCENKKMLIGPKEFKERYAPSVGIESIRELFRSESFPSVEIGSGKRNRLYTTPEAAERWLAELG